MRSGRGFAVLRDFGARSSLRIARIRCNFSISASISPTISSMFTLRGYRSIESHLVDHRWEFLEARLRCQTARQERQFGLDLEVA